MNSTKISTCKFQKPTNGKPDAIDNLMFLNIYSATQIPKAGHIFQSPGEVEEEFAFHEMKSSIENQEMLCHLAE
jgi:hypothetical protein